MDQVAAMLPARRCGSRYFLLMEGKAFATVEVVGRSSTRDASHRWQQGDAAVCRRLNIPEAAALGIC